jgi:spermidine synthase
VIWYFVFFFISGFCSVLYELVWLRLAMAQFGVTTAMVSIVLSVFMGGLGLGSWLSGKWLENGNGSGTASWVPPLRLYALIELLIGVSGVVAPWELFWGRHMLANLDLSSSFVYYSAAGLWVAAALVPWCALMGATIPVAMKALGQMFPGETGRSFSYLYMANVAGAVAGTVLPLFLIELLGFRGTLKVGVACNALIAVSATLFSRRRATSGESATSRSIPADVAGSASLLLLLFFTGLTSMGMEVVWVRQFTPYLGTVVYAFASILAVYLIATFSGARIYRWWSDTHARESAWLWTLLALAALLPLLTSSPYTDMSKGLRLTLGIMPFTGLLGFITPMLVDRFSSGDPGYAGRAYAINVVGCILGPLLAGFGLLPYWSERTSLVLLSVPWLIVGIKAVLPNRATSAAARGAAYALLPVAALMVSQSKGYEEKYPQRQVLRDSTATVMATGSGMRKKLLVNGYGMTVLSPVTKMMAHLPLAFLDHPPQSALDICFGMGTTFRSLMTWNIQVTAVELVPSVPRLFGYFHPDGPQLFRSPLAKVVIDDGRRYLERTDPQYDLITIDPPPPPQAAGSSLLYSEEFCDLARKHLRPGGILAQFLPYGDAEDFSAVARALKNTFPYVRVFYWKTTWGYHFLASGQPLPNRTAAELAQKLPPSAAADFVEWGPERDAEHQFAWILGNEIDIDKIVARSPITPALRDDRPVNEYYMLRKMSQEQTTLENQP